MFQHTDALILDELRPATACWVLVTPPAAHSCCSSFRHASVSLHWLVKLSIWACAATSQLQTAQVLPSMACLRARILSCRVRATQKGICAAAAAVSCLKCAAGCCCMHTAQCNLTRECPIRCAMIITLPSCSSKVDGSHSESDVSSLECPIKSRLIAMYLALVMSWT